MKKETPIRKSINKIKEQMEVAIKHRDESTSDSNKQFWTGIHDGLDMACVFLWQQLENEKNEFCTFAQDGAIDFYHDVDPWEKYNEVYEV